MAQDGQPVGDASLLDEIVREGARRMLAVALEAVTGERKRFASAILPPWVRRSPKLAEVLPLLYLHGLSHRGLRSGPGTVPR